MSAVELSRPWWIVKLCAIFRAPGNDHKDELRMNDRLFGEDEVSMCIYPAPAKVSVRRPLVKVWSPGVALDRDGFLTLPEILAPGHARKMREVIDGLVGRWMDRPRSLRTFRAPTLVLGLRLSRCPLLHDLQARPRGIQNPLYLHSRRRQEIDSW